MAARIQLPAKAKRGEIVEIRVLIQHPMETGYRRDDVGRPIKRNVINELSCRYDGVEVFRADLSSGIAANPYLQFYTVAEKSGEIEFNWIDDEGKQGSERQSIQVSA
jgi:sulfur-oxidizing protein SoxZ